MWKYGAGISLIRRVSGTEQSGAEVRSALTSLTPTLARSVVLAGAFEMTAARSPTTNMYRSARPNPVWCGETISREQLTSIGKDDADTTP